MSLDLDRLLLAPCHAVWGEAVIYRPGDGPDASLTGVFNEKYTRSSFQDDTAIAGEMPMLNVRHALFGRLPVQNELFHIRGVWFAAIGVEPDGFGDVKIHLRAASDAEGAKPVPIP